MGDALWIYSSSTSYFMVLTHWAAKQINRQANEQPDWLTDCNGMDEFQDSHKDVTKVTALQTIPTMATATTMTTTTTKMMYPNWKIASHKSKTDTSHRTVNSAHTRTVMQSFLCDCQQIKIISRSSHMALSGHKYIDWSAWQQQRKIAHVFICVVRIHSCAACVHLQIHLSPSSTATSF